MFRRQAYYHASMIFVILGIIYFLFTINQPYIGLNIQNANGRWLVTVSDPTGEGYRAGVRVGNQVLKVNGDIPSNYSNVKKWSRVEGASSLELIRSDQQLSTIVQLPTRISWIENSTEIPLKLLGFVFLLLGFLTWFKRPFLDQARAIFWLNWIMGLAIVFSAASARCLFFGRELEYISLSLVPIFLINLVSVFPKENRNKANQLSSIVFKVISVVIIVITILQSNGIIHNASSTLSKLLISTLIIALLVTLKNLGLPLRIPKDRPEKNQVSILFFGMFIGFFPFISLTAIPQLLDLQPIKYFDFSSLFLSVVPVSWYYVIVNKYLPDSRRLFESIITFLITSIIISFSISYVLLTLGIMEVFNLEEYLAPLAITMLLMVCINIINYVIRRLLEKLAFFERKQGFKESILKLNESLPSVNEEDYILEEAVTSLNVQGAYIIIENPKKGYLTKALGTFLENPSQQAELEELFQGSQRANLEAIILPENLPAEIFIPVNSGDFSCGIFLGHRHSHIKFDADELPLITLIASQLAQRLITSFVIKELSVEIKSLAQCSQDSQRRNQGLQGITNALFKNLEQERARVAADIYDGPLQLGLDLNRWLKYLLEECSIEEKTKNAVSHMRDLVENLNFELRQISNDLSPTALKDLGLLTAVELLCEEIMLKELALIALNTVSLGREDRFPAEIELTAYRFLQEGIFNAVKHSGANKLTISIEKTEANLELMVKDRGKGFDTDKIGEWSLTGIHFGIIGMKERIESLGGSLQITSQIHRGTVLKATLPII